MNLDARTKLYVALSAVFVTSLVVGDTIGGKLLATNAFGIEFVISAGMLPFPVTFLLTDLLNEFYGKKAARFTTWVGLGMAALAYLLFGVAVALPWAPFTRDASWQGMNQPSFDNVFSGSQRILVASMIAYVVGQLLDIAVFNRLKTITHGRLLWLRATGSTVISQLVDTVIVQLIAWVGLLSIGKILEIVATSYAVKLLVAIGLTPLIYAGHALVERLLHMRPVVLDDAGNPVEPAPGADGSASYAASYSPR